MNNVSAATSLTPPALPCGTFSSDQWHRGESLPKEQPAVLPTGRKARVHSDTLSALKHHEYGKISETTDRWLTQGHRAFARLKCKPKSASAILGSKQLSSASNVWVVTEKVHGSNFSFVCFPPEDAKSPPTIRCAKREEFLDDKSDEDNTSFFGFRKVKNRYQAAAEQAFTTVVKQFASNEATASGDVVRLTIYGELFGGIFPGLTSPPDVIAPVQEGVYYHPDLDYMAFGATVMLQPAETTVTTVELDFLPAMAMLQRCGFFTAEALHLGSFTDCCNFDLNFTTTIPGRLGVDPQARAKIAATNLAEGIVCRTNIAQMVPVTGDKPDDHCMFKRKRDDFASYCSANAQGIAGEQNRSLVSSDKASFLDCIDHMIRSRLIDSALSKTGKPITKNRKANKQLCQQISELVLTDVKEEVSTMTFAASTSGKKPVKTPKTGAFNATVSGDRLIARHLDDIDRLIADALRDKTGK